MKRLLTLFAAAAAIIGVPTSLRAQGGVQDFGGRTTELKEVAAIELPKPDIPDIQIGDNPVITPVIRPLYLVYRYYSCSPWYPFYVKNVFNDVVPKSQFQVEIDTAGAVNPGDNVDGQIVTDINHPAFGLYCITIRVCVPWDQWIRGLWKRWYIRWGYRAPYWCWQDHWWYYWQRKYVTLTMNSAQEVPPNSSSATSTATVAIGQDGTVDHSVPFSGLTSVLTAAHFHGPALPGVNAGVIVGLDTTPVLNLTSGTMTGTVAPNAALINALQSGQAYLNIHTVNFPGGEIRGQVPVIFPGCHLVPVLAVPGMVALHPVDPHL